MAFRWAQHPSMPKQQRAAPNSPMGSKASSGKQRVDMSSPNQWSEPPPLDERTAKYVLSVMILLLRHTKAEAPSRGATNASFRHGYHQDVPPPLVTDAMFGNLSSDGRKSGLRHRHSSQSVKSSTPSVSSALPGPAGSPTYEKTDPSLLRSYSSISSLIATFAGRIVFHVSASNWPVVLHRLRSRIHQLASTNEENPDLIDLHVLSYSCLDTPRLINILNGAYQIGMLSPSY